MSNQLIRTILISGLLAFQGVAWAAEDRWYDIQFQGQKVGYLHTQFEKTQEAGGPAIHARSRSFISVKRLQQEVKMEHIIDAWFRPDGTPLRYELTRKEGGEVRSGRGRRVGNKLEVEHTVGGRKRVRAFDLQPTDRFASSVEYLYCADLKPRKLTGRIIDEMEGIIQPYQLEIKSEGSGQLSGLEVVGKIKNQLKLDPKHCLVRSEIVGAGIALQRTTAKAALQASQAVDIFSAALFPVKERLPDRGRIKSLTVRLRRPGAQAPSVGEFSGQKVVPKSKDSVDVVTQRAPPVSRSPSSGAPDLMKALMKAYLVSTDYEDLSDPLLQAAAHRETGTAKTAWDKAKSINRFVHQHLRDKTLAHAYASATEALSSRSGDCTEHSVLFSALAKIVGIPTRLVTGLVYVGGAQPAFGYHEWVEVWVDERWHPMDPTFGQDTADATHIKFSEGLSDSEGLRDAGLAAASLIGDVKLQIVNIETD